MFLEGGLIMKDKKGGEYKVVLQQEMTAGDDQWIDISFHSQLRLIRKMAVSEVNNIDDDVDPIEVERIVAKIDLENNPKLVNILLSDRSTGGNIRWATDNYVERNGGRFDEAAQVLPELIIGENSDIIVPRAMKDADVRKSRTQKNAEVFTPSWIVDKQVSAVLDDFEDLSFDEFMATTWLEITCGEAPYMANRYDMETGVIIDLNDRKGFIDRKFQRLNDEVSSENNLRWWKYAQEIYKSSYGYEYQGDSLLLARMNLLLTFVDNYIEVFNKEPSKHMLWRIAEIISWNVFQMDGLEYTVPYAMLNDVDVNARMMNWVDETELDFKELLERDGGNE